jgi:Dolichyl-phosphate-mannose-protein mannosyltransferase
MSIAVLDGRPAAVRSEVARVSLESLPYFQILFVSAVLLSIVSAYLFSINGLQIAHFDSKGHLLVARRLFDNLNPGLKQIGAFWLPLPHLLYFPFVHSDRLYFDGLAALPITMTCFVATVLVLFKLIERIFSPFAAFCGASLYLTNPNMLYLQSTPLTENVALLFMLGCVYLFVLFVEKRKRSYLFASALLSAVGILSRYENWFVTALICVLILIIDIKEKRGFREFLIDGLVFAPVNVAAAGLTFFINWWTTGLVYMDHSFKHTDFQPARGSFFLSLMVIFYTIANLISYEWTIFAIIAFVIVFRNKFRSSTFLASLALLAPFILYLLEYRDNHPTRVRYGIPFIPATMFFLSYWVDRSRISRYLFLVFAVYIALFSPFYVVDSSRLLQESMRDAENNALEYDLVWYLQAHDDGQLILATMAEIAPLLYDLKLPVKRYVHEGAKPYWNDADKHPEKVVSWVFLSQDDRLWKRFHDDPEFHKHFALIGRSGFLELYHRTPDEKFNIASHKPHATNDKNPFPANMPGI